MNKKQSERDYFNILIVDDDLEICSLIQEYLEKLPKLMKFVYAHDGVSALNKLRNQEFDLITLDMRMPRLAGYDILGEISYDKFNSINSVLVISGSIDKDVFMIATTNGVKNFLVKPFEEDAFTNKVLKILPIIPNANPKNPDSE